jgi:hypothetical protein
MDQNIAMPLPFPLSPPLPSPSAWKELIIWWNRRERRVTGLTEVRAIWGKRVDLAVGLSNREPGFLEVI